MPGAKRIHGGFGFLGQLVCQERSEFITFFLRFWVTGMPGARRIHSGFGVFGTSDLSKIDLGTPGGPIGTAGGPEGRPERHFDTPMGH